MPNNPIYGIPSWIATTAATTRVPGYSSLGEVRELFIKGEVYHLAYGTHDPVRVIDVPDQPPGNVMVYVVNLTVSVIDNKGLTQLLPHTELETLEQSRQRLACEELRKKSEAAVVRHLNEPLINDETDFLRYAMQGFIMKTKAIVPNTGT